MITTKDNLNSYRIVQSNCTIIAPVGYSTKLPGYITFNTPAPAPVPAKYNFKYQVAAIRLDDSASELSNISTLLSNIF